MRAVVQVKGFEGRIKILGLGQMLQENKEGFRAKTMALSQEQGLQCKDPGKGVDFIVGQGWDFRTRMKASGKGKVRNFRARMRAQARTWASGKGHKVIGLG